MLTFDLVNSFVHIVFIQLPVHALKGSQVNKSASAVYKTILFSGSLDYTNKLRYVSLKSEQFQILTP